MNSAQKPLHHKIFTPIREFISDSRAIGIILIICTIVSLLLSNSHFTNSFYLSFWQHPVHFPIKFLNMPDTNLLWVNDVLMTFFFFLVGMEIKRELTIGELASVKKSLLPIIAAVGGMVLPALIFTLFNAKTPFHHGWGIPMATDIAFSLGILSLLGKKVPVQLKIFLTALAIIDDLGAVVTIAVFYSIKLHFFYLLGAALSAAAVILLNRFKVRKVGLYFIPGLILWYCLFNSGVHATIAGVVMAFTMPLSQLAKLEKKLFIPVNFFIMPLFALANTAIIFPSDFSSVYSSTLSSGVLLGLVCGKPLGIFLFSFLATKMGIASLPSNTNYKQLWGIGMIGGIGFTMSIFTSTIAYSSNTLQVVSKVSIITASVIAGFMGFIYLNRLFNYHERINIKNRGELINVSIEEKYLPSPSIA
jgi:NhaA family Na+:H+ antiporter